MEKVYRLFLSFFVDSYSVLWTSIIPTLKRLILLLFSMYFDAKFHEFVIHFCMISVILFQPDDGYCGARNISLQKFDASSVRVSWLGWGRTLMWIGSFKTILSLSFEVFNFYYKQKMRNCQTWRFIEKLLRN